MQTVIPDPKSFFTQRGGLHDARIRQIGWDAPARTISVKVGDLNANALGLPDHTGAEPGTLVFHDAEDLMFGCDAFVNDVQRVYDVEIEESGGGKYRCTLLISPGGRLTFGFSSVALVAGPRSEGISSVPSGYRLERTMGKVKRMVLVVPAVLIALIGAYLVARIAASLMQGYSWQEMDWYQRGGTSLEDFLAASEIGKREINQEGKKCVEYFSYKDGLSVKVVCSK